MRAQNCLQFVGPAEIVCWASELRAAALAAMSGNMDPEQAMTMAKEEVLYRVDLFNAMVSGRHSAARGALASQALAEGRVRR